MYVRPSVPVFLLAAVHPELGGALLLAPGAQRGEQQETADSRGRVTTIRHICNMKIIHLFSPEYETFAVRTIIIYKMLRLDTWVTILGEDMSVASW